MAVNEPSVEHTLERSNDGGGLKGVGRYYIYFMDIIFLYYPGSCVVYYIYSHHNYFGGRAKIILKKEEERGDLLGRES